MKSRDMWKSNNRLIVLLLVWIVVYGRFTLWWLPVSGEFWLHILPPVWLLLFLGFEAWYPRRRKWKLAVPVVLLCVLLCLNLVCVVLPDSDIENNDMHQLAKELHDYGIDSDDLIVMRHNNNLSGYYQLYFNSPLHTTSLSLLTGKIDKYSIFIEVREQIESTLASGSKVLLSEDELNPEPDPISTLLGESSVVRTTDHIEFYAPYQDRLKELFEYKHNNVEKWMFELHTHSLKSDTHLAGC